MMSFLDWSTVLFFDNRRDRLFNLGRFFLVRPLEHLQEICGLQFHCPILYQIHPFDRHHMTP